MATPTEGGTQFGRRLVLALLSSAGLGVLGFVIGGALLAGTILVLAFGVGVELTEILFLSLYLVFVQGVGFGGVAFGYVRLRPYIAGHVRDLLGIEGPLRQFDIGLSVPSWRDVAVVIVGYVLALGCAIGGTLVISQLGVETGTNSGAQTAMDNPEIIPFLILAAFLLIGPGEELLFRGVIQGRLREVLGPVAGILLPSAGFAGIHIAALQGGSLTGNLLVVSVLFFPAIVFGTSYEYTDNIVVPSLIHGAYNATLFAGLYVSLTYGGEVSQGAALAV